MRVLVVEDDTPIRTLLVDLLAGEGHVVSQAANGAEALRAFKAGCPDAVILDLMLPDMTGAQIAEQCYRQMLGLPVPILLMSASPHLWPIAERLRGFGVRGFISKPFDIDVFLSTLRALTATPATLQLAG